jgi:hypothetical protein
MRRKDMLVHEQNNEFHIGMAVSAVSEMQDTVTGLTSTVIELKGTVVELIDTMVKVKETSYFKAGTDVVPKQQPGMKTAPVTFSVAGFQSKKDMDMKYTSPSFYTRNRGYRMAVRVFPNGDGEGRDTHVSVCAPILEGKYDSELSWPFTGTITFTLLNQLEDRNHYSHTTVLNTENKAVVGVDWGKPKFISHPKLLLDADKKIQYLKDDALFFRVSVSVNDHKPWLECTSSTTRL